MLLLTWARQSTGALVARANAQSAAASILTPTLASTPAGSGQSASQQPAVGISVHSKKPGSALLLVDAIQRLRARPRALRDPLSASLLGVTLSLAPLLAACPRRLTGVDIGAIFTP